MICLFIFYKLLTIITERKIITMNDLLAVVAKKIVGFIFVILSSEINFK